MFRFYSISAIYNSRNSKELLDRRKKLWNKTIYNSRNSKELLDVPYLIVILKSTTVEIQRNFLITNERRRAENLQQ